MNEKDKHKKEVNEMKKNLIDNFNEAKRCKDEEVLNKRSKI